MKLTEIQLDALREVANIGAGNAATSLSRLLEKRIRMHVPSVHLLPIQEVAEALGGREQVVTAIYLQIHGSATAGFMLLFSEEGARKLASHLLGRWSRDAVRWDELAESALKEMGNVFTGSYFTALSQMVSLRFFQSVPDLATDMLQSVLDNALIQLAREAEHALVFETKFEAGAETIPSYCLFIPEPEGWLAVLGALHLEAKKGARS